MTDRALKQYIREKYDIKVKRIGLCGPYYTLSYNFDGQGGCWDYTNKLNEYGHLLHNRLFTTLAELVDVLENAKSHGKEINQCQQ